MLYTGRYLVERTIFIKLISKFSNWGFSVETWMLYLYYYQNRFIKAQLSLSLLVLMNSKVSKYFKSIY